MQDNITSSLLKCLESAYKLSPHVMQPRTCVIELILTLGYPAASGRVLFKQVCLSDLSRISMVQYICPGQGETSNTVRQLFRCYRSARMLNFAPHMRRTCSIYAHTVSAPTRLFYMRPTPIPHLQHLFPHPQKIFNTKLTPVPHLQSLLTSYPHGEPLLNCSVTLH